MTIYVINSNSSFTNEYIRQHATHNIDVIVPNNQQLAYLQYFFKKPSVDFPSIPYPQIRTDFDSNLSVMLIYSSLIFIFLRKFFGHTLDCINHIFKFRESVQNIFVFADAVNGENGLNSYIVGLSAS